MNTMNARIGNVKVGTGKGGEYLLLQFDCEDGSRIAKFAHLDTEKALWKFIYELQSVGIKVSSKADILANLWRLPCMECRVSVRDGAVAKAKTIEIVGPAKTEYATDEVMAVLQNDKNDGIITSIIRNLEEITEKLREIQDNE